jgi:acetolactate synthase-1/2/3 large subunit
MNRHAGDVLVEMLLEYGVPAVFGLAGGQTLPLYDAIRSRRNRIRHVPMRDERSAAYAADGYARISGRVGVCDATVGPGSIKFASGLAEALNSSVPIVALISDMPSDWLTVRHRGGGNQLIDQLAVLDPLCKWTGRLPSVQKLPELVQRAFQMATTGRAGPVTIELPQDLFMASYDGPEPRTNPTFGSAPAYRPAPDPDAVRPAIDLLTSAERPVMIVGGGVMLSHASGEIVKLAERVALPVATTLSGKGALPENHPLSAGVLGSLGGSKVARKLAEDADVIFAVGFKFGQNPTYMWSLPTPGQKIIHLDIDGEEIGKLFPVEVGMVADARVGLKAMLAACTVDRPVDTVAAQIAALRAEWEAQLAAEAAAASPIRPQQVAAVINQVAGGDDILVCDASFASGWGGMYYEIRGNRRTIFPRGMAGLGWGLPAAIGAQIARPNSKIIVLAGDGAMTYCLGELATLAQEGLPVKVVVLNNSVMGWIKWEQAVFWEGKFQSTDLSRVDFARAAEGLGCQGMSVAEPGDLQEAIAATLASDAPTLVDVSTSASEAAMPKFTESAAAKARMQATS